MFNGKCEEALHYYKDIFNGEISSIMRYKESPYPMAESPDSSNMVMHATFKFRDNTIMASDNIESNFKKGNNCHLSILADDEDEAYALFKSLANDGSVTMPFDVVFWGGKFGMVTDKYGINWMISCD